MFVGQGRAGKTSTLKALTGQPFDAREESTHGMTAGAATVRADQGRRLLANARNQLY